MDNPGDLLLAVESEFLALGKLERRVRLRATATGAKIARSSLFVTDDDLLQWLQKAAAATIEREALASDEQCNGKAKLQQLADACSSRGGHPRMWRIYSQLLTPHQVSTLSRVFGASMPSDEQHSRNRHYLLQRALEGHKGASDAINQGAA